MADVARSIPRMSANEYLERERDAAYKHEFANGVVYAIAADSREHNFISGDVYAALLGQLRSPCQVFTSDMKVRIRTASDEFYYYPDTTVTCSELDNDRYALAQPPIIVEALSRSTEEADRGYKFEGYKKLSSLQEYVLVHQERPCVEIYRRRCNWEKELYEREAQITFESAGITLPVAQFYRRVES